MCLYDRCRASRRSSLWTYNRCVSCARRGICGLRVSYGDWRGALRTFHALPDGVVRRLKTPFTVLAFHYNGHSQLIHAILMRPARRFGPPGLNTLNSPCGDPIMPTTQKASREISIVSGIWNLPVGNQLNSFHALNAATTGGRQTAPAYSAGMAMAQRLAVEPSERLKKRIAVPAQRTPTIRSPQTALRCPCRRPFPSRNITKCTPQIGTNRRQKNPRSITKLPADRFSPSAST